MPLGGAKEGFLGGGILERGRSALGLFRPTPLRPRMNARRGVPVSVQGPKALGCGGQRDANGCLCLVQRLSCETRRLAGVGSVVSTNRRRERIGWWRS